MSVKIICDSASDITIKKAREWDVTVLPLKTIFGEEEYLDGQTLSADEFYQKLIETDRMPTTSQVSPAQYREVFEEIAENGDTAVCLTISSKLSGCYQSANIALEGLETSIILVDTESVTIGEQLLVQQAVILRSMGKTALEIAAEIEVMKKQVRLIALFDTLEYLKKGGRLSAAAAFAGELLNLKPVAALVNGEITLMGKARGSKNGNNLLMELVRKEGGIDFDRPLLLGYTGLSDVLLQKYIRDSKTLYEGKTDSLPVTLIGSTIGTHAGPGAIGLAFFGNNSKDAE